MKIVGLDHVQVTIPIGKEDEARAFYCGVMGLIEIPKPVALETRGGLWLEVGGLQVHVGTEAKPTETTKAHVAYQVDDLVAWRAHLVGNGIAVVGSVPIEGFDRFEFADPFGNRVELISHVK